MSLSRSPDQQSAHETAVAQNLKYVSDLPNGRAVLGALVTLADGCPYSPWAADAFLGLVNCVFENDAADIAKLRETLAQMPEHSSLD